MQSTKVLPEHYDYAQKVLVGTRLGYTYIIVAQENLYWSLITRGLQNHPSVNNASVLCTLYTYKRIAYMPICLYVTSFTVFDIIGT